MNPISRADSLLDLNEDRTFRAMMNDYRKERKLTNVELEVSGKLFPAHRLILSLNSPVLDAAFSENWTQSKIYPLSDEHVDVEIMEDLLNFFYTGSIHFTPENAHPICMAAHFLQIWKLLDPCVNFLCELINIDNVLTFFVFSIRHDLDVLQKACLKFISITHNYVQLFEDSHFLELPSTDFKELIAGLKTYCRETDFLKNNSFGLRATTFRMIIRWTKQDLSNRLDELPVLLENIPLAELPYRFFAETVCKHPLVKEFPCVQDILKPLNFTTIEAVLDTQSVLLNQKLVFLDKLGSVLSYDEQSKTWRKLPPLLQSRQNFAFTVIEGSNNRQEIIVSGGLVRSKATGSVEMFDWNTQAWRKLRNMPKPMESHSMAYHNGHLYIAGGLSKKFRSGISRLVFQYSFETKRWKNVKRMKHERFESRLISYQSHLYVIDESLKAVERYDPEQNKWTDRCSMPCSRFWERTVHGATLHQNRIYVSGTDKLEIYDPEGNFWKSLSVPAITRSTNLVSLNGKLLALSSKLFPGIEDEVSVREIDLNLEVEEILSN